MIIHQVINHDTSSWKRVRITPVTTTRMCCVRLQQPSRHPLRPCVCVTQLFPILELQYINQLCMCVQCYYSCAYTHPRTHTHTITWKSHPELAVLQAHLAPAAGKGAHESKLWAAHAVNNQEEHRCDDAVLEPALWGWGTTTWRTVSRARNRSKKCFRSWGLTAQRLIFPWIHYRV